MNHIDVFNGDADGICALIQLRLAMPVEATLVTGVKRDVALLDRVDGGHGDTVTVLDVSLDVNRAALSRLLDAGAHVDYFDHHYPGAVPSHANLRAYIDPSATACTSLLVDRHLHGRDRAWAVVGAFGDNLSGPARACAASLGLGHDDIARLRELGELIAYNAYGDSEADLVFHPAVLYRALRDSGDPFTFIRDAPQCRRLADQRSRDMAMAALAQPHAVLAGAVVYVLDDDAWTRRVRGALANDLANSYTHLAHAVLTPDGAGGYMVSVRAPLASPQGADALCRKFANGGGRVAAAGINHLSRDELPRFVAEMDRAFPAPSRPPAR